MKHGSPKTHDDLKSCPFCGKKARMSVIPPESTSTLWEAEVFCGSCFGTGPRERGDLLGAQISAAKRWNRRVGGES